MQPINISHSASLDQATSSVETLTGLVQQVLQTNQELCLRIRNLELLPSDPTVRSAASFHEHDDEDGASTIRPKRLASDPGSEASDNRLRDITSFAFEQDLRQSKVYRRVWRRNSTVSLSSSAAPSFGWSCLSEMSLANVSNISVISLPIAANELSNGEHYRGLPRKVHNSNSHKAGPLQITPSLDHGMSDMTQSSRSSEKRIAILGEKFSLCIFNLLGATLIVIMPYLTTAARCLQILKNDR